LQRSAARKIALIFLKRSPPKSSPKDLDAIFLARAVDFAVFCVHAAAAATAIACCCYSNDEQSLLLFCS